MRQRETETETETEKLIEEKLDGIRLMDGWKDGPTGQKDGWTWIDGWMGVMD